MSEELTPEQAADELSREAQELGLYDPPLTSEEEEELAQDACGACGHEGDAWFDRSVCAEPCGSMHYRCGNCGSVVDGGPCLLEQAPPPRPRRDPIHVTYVVDGQMYEAVAPGDARVCVEEGKIVISHYPDPVLGIVRVMPLEER